MGKAIHTLDDLDALLINGGAQVEVVVDVSVDVLEGDPMGPEGSYSRPNVISNNSMFVFPGAVGAAEE